MCTMIAQQINVRGSGKAGTGWFRVETASVSYDHPFDMPLEYTMNLDFTSQSGAPGMRVAVELDAASARALVEAIRDVMKQAEAGGFVEGSDL
jgi:DNA-directed RNA polymerase subunit L